MIFAMYWKQIVVGLSLLLSIGLIYHKGYTEGKASIQAEWDQQKIVDAQAVAIADNKTATIVTQSNKQTGLANEQFIHIIDSAKDYYTTHFVPGVHYATELLNATTKTSSGKMSIVSDPTRQSDEKTANTISRADYDSLADQCLATTIQLDNAQDWAKEQVKIYDTEQ